MVRNEDHPEKLSFAGESVTVAGLKGWFCPGCGEGELDQEGSKRYAMAHDALIHRARSDPTKGRHPASTASLRIGRTVPHAPCVDTEQITALFAPCRVWRYRLTLPFRNRDAGKGMAVILKNPSSASEHSSDKTVRTVCETVWRRYPEIGSVTILNLFALRGTDSREVGEAIRQQGLDFAVGPENDSVIAETLFKSQAAIIAWGGPAGISRQPYQERISQCANLLANSRLPVFRNNRKGSDTYPFHACYWGYADELVPVTVEVGIPNTRAIS
jgi:YgiT-type zinc finger domain-containing protein